MLNANKNLSPMSEVLLVVVKGIVDDPDKVLIKEVQGEQTLVIQITVARTDVGKVLGKKGVMADSLRTVMRSIAAKHHVRAVLDIES